MKRIAIFSPSKNAYSETFIRAHRDRLQGKIFFYSGETNLWLNGIPIKPNKIIWIYYKVLTFLKYRTWKESNALLISKSIKRNKIEAILVEYGNHAFNLLPVLIKSKIPFVTHFHGYDASVNSLIEYCDYYKDVFKYSNKIIVVSKVMRDMILNLGCDFDKLILAPYGPNEKFFEVKPNFSEKVFFGMGRFVNKKAPYFTILAFNNVVKIHPDAKLVLAGDGPLMDTCFNLTKHLKLDDHITFLGVVDPNQAMSLMENAICFVQHSITAMNGDMEGTPVAVLEACAAGIPVVSTRHAGISDVIIHGETGFLCDEGDVEAMSNYMCELAADIKRAREIGTNARSNIKTNFSLVQHIEKIQMALRS